MKKPYRSFISVTVSISIFLSMIFIIKMPVYAEVQAIKLADLTNQAYVEVVGSAYTLGEGPQDIHKNWYQASYTSTDRLYSMSTGNSNTVGDGYAIKIQKDNNLAELSIDASGATNIVAKYWLKDATNANDISEVIQYTTNAGISYQPFPDKTYPSSSYRVHRLEGADNNADVKIRINGLVRNGHIVWLDDISIFSDTTAPTWNAPALNATNITDAGFRLSWDIALDNTNSLESGVRYYRIYKNGELLDTVTNTTSYDVTGLISNQSYLFSITAGDVAGNWSGDGPIGTFATAAGSDIIPPQWTTPAAITVTNLGQRSMTISWTGAIDDTGVQRYGIYMDSVLQASVTSDVYSYDFTGLAPATNYNIKIEAADVTGNWSTDGPGIQVNTLDSGIPYVKEDFDSGVIQAGWELSQGGGTISLVDDPLTLHGQSLELIDNNSSKSVSARYSIGKKTNALTLEYRFMHKDSVGTMYLPVYGSISGGSDREFFRLSTGSQNMLTFGNDSNAYTNIGEIQANKWYFVKVIVDIDKQVSYFSITVDDGTRFVSGENKLYSITSSPYTPVAMNRIGFYTKSTDIAQLYIDDIKVYDANLSVDTPAWASDKSLIASEISKKEIKLQWSEASDYLGIKSYAVYKDDIRIASVPGNMRSFTVNELNPGTAYNFRIEAEDAGGNLSVDGPVLQISTSPKDETEPPSWIDASLSAPVEDIDANTLKLVWTPASDNTGVTAYRIYQDDNLITTLPGNILSYTVTGLTQNTNYRFRVSAGDASDNWGEGPELEISTIGDEKPPFWVSPYFGMESDSSTTGKLSISWRGASDNVEVTQYRIYEGENLVETVNQPAFVIEGLIPGEKHTYYVAAGDAAGNWSTDMAKATFQLHDPLLPTWQSGVLTTENVSTSTLTLKWNGATDNGRVSKYRIYCDGVLFSIVEGSLNEYKATGLLHDTQYHFKIQAVDAMNNESIDGPAVAVTTAPSEDIIPPMWSDGEIEVSDLTTNSISLSWCGATDAAGITGYRISVGDSVIQTLYNDTDTYTLFDLAPGMPYTISVQACDAAGNWSIDGPSVETATVPVFGTTRYVASIDELNNAIAIANPGDMIILQNGIYETGAITPVIGKHGLPNAKIVIRASEAGMAEIKAATGFKFTNCSYITVEGIKFTGVQTLAANEAAINMLGCNNMRITRCHFMLDESLAQNEVGYSLAWVTIKSDNNIVSHHNHIDRNLFEKKLAPGVMLSIDGDWEAKQVSQYDIIEYNHFKDSKPRVTNGKEAIRYGTSYNSQSSAYGIVQYNLFEECDGDPEYLSIKSSDVTIRYNTFLNNMGQFTFRHGDRNTAYSNYFIGDGLKTGVGGMRIYGTDHKVFGNYFQGLTAQTLQIDGGDSYFNGKLTDKWTIRRMQISFNTIIDCSYGITVWGGREYAPQDITIANNLVVNSGGISYTTSKSAVAGIPTPRPVYQGNIVYPTLYPSGKTIAETNDAAAPQEIAVMDPLLELSNGIYRPSASSPVLGAAAGNYPYVTEDIDGQKIPVASNVGADQTVDSPTINKILTAADVGLSCSTNAPVWQDGNLSASEINTNSLKLTWEGAVDNKAITQFRIYAENRQVVSVIGNVNSVIVSGLLENSQYTFKVLALDEEGNVNLEGPTVTISTLKSDSSNSTPIPVSGKENVTGTIKVETVPEGKNGKEAKCVIEEGKLKKAFENAKPDEKGNRVVIAEVSEISEVNSYKLTLPAKILASEDTSKKLKINTAVASVTIPENMLNNSNISEIGDSSVVDLIIGVKTGKDEKADLPGNVKTTIGDRPLVQLTLMQNGEKIQWSNPGAPVIVSIPYKPTQKELQNPEHIVVWYIDGKGNVVAVPNGRYDKTTGRVTFTTTHFSNYVVAYVQKTFKDIDSVKWAKKSIEVMASKGIISGYGDNIFSPAVNISRADYLVLLIKTLELTADFNDNFDDVIAGTYYYEAVGIAKKLGIVEGSGNNLFNPEESITRQDMIVLTTKALKRFKGLKDANNSSVLDKFSDKGEIAGYAVESLAVMVEEGFILGNGDTLNPRGKTTRAEAAVLLYKIYYMI